MTILWIIIGVLLGIVFLFLFLALFPIHIILEYREQLTIHLSILFFKSQILPKSKKKVRFSDYFEPKRKKQKQVQRHIKNYPDEKADILETLGNIREILEIFFKNVLGSLRLRTSRIHISVATKDAAKTAVLFGAVNQGVIFLLEALDQFDMFQHTKNHDIKVFPDFISEKTSTDIHLDFSLRIWQILRILV